MNANITDCGFILRHSDDRSQEVFQRSIEAATQMQALSVVDGRPNCLVIDEIDGAPTVSPHHPTHDLKNPFCIINKQ